MMSRRACFLVIGCLAVAWGVTRRRARQREIEAQEARASALVGDVPAQPLAAEPKPSSGEAMATSEAGSKDATPAQDISAEWEQAVPPTDS